MGESRIAHDAAWACTVALMQILGPAFAPEEVGAATQMIYEHIKACVNAAFMMKNQEARRLNPGRN